MFTSSGRPATRGKVLLSTVLPLRRGRSDSEEEKISAKLAQMSNTSNIDEDGAGNICRGTEIGKASRSRPFLFLSDVGAENTTRTCVIARDDFGAASTQYPNPYRKPSSFPSCIPPPAPPSHTVGRPPLGDLSVSDPRPRARRQDLPYTDGGVGSAARSVDRETKGRVYVQQRQGVPKQVRHTQWCNMIGVSGVLVICHLKGLK